jgi:helicase MOV-10
MTSTQACPTVLVNGTCDNTSCTYSHTILTCDPCGFVFQSPKEYNQHLGSKNHRSKILGDAIAYYCSICNANVPSHKGWEQHIQGRIHQQKADDAGVSIDVAPQPAISTASATACDLCQIVLPNRFWKEHLKKEDHKLREQYSRYMIAVEQSETNRNGVVVEGSFDFEFIDPPEAEVGKESTISVKASKPSSKFVLLEAKLASHRGNSGVSS